MTWYNDPKNIKLVRNESYFFVDKYQKDTCFFHEDAYYYYDIDVDRILLFQKVTINILLDVKI